MNRSITRAPDLSRRRVALAGLLAILLLSFIGDNSLSVYSNADSGDALRQVGVTLVCVMLLAFTHVRHGWRHTSALPVSLLVVFVYCLMSSTWALAPFISLRRLASTVMVAWAVFRAAGELGPVATLQTLRNVAMALIVASYLVLIFTTAGTHHSFDDFADLIGNWRGIFVHKNVAGEFLGMAIVMFVFDPVPTPRLMRYGFLLAAVVFLWESHSKTVIGVIGLALAVGWLMRTYNPRHLSRAALIVLVGCAVALPVASVYSGRLIAVIEDPTGFSGRSAIWQYMWIYAQSHLWTGAGYGSFWQIGRDSPILRLSSDWVADAGHGHNGYLDLLVTVGAPGLVMAVLAAFVWPTVLLLIDDAMPAAQRAWCAATLVFIFCDNMTETSLLDRAAVLEVVLMLTLAVIHRSAERDGRRPGAYAALGLGFMAPHAGSARRRPLFRIRP